MGLRAAAETKHKISVADPTVSCHHCGSRERSLNKHGFCCHGCETAHAVIRSLGLEAFYELPDFKLDPVDLIQKDPVTLDYFDHPKILQRISNGDLDAPLEVELQIGGLTCFACAWLIETSIRKLDSQLNVVVNLRRHSLTLAFDPQRVRLSQVIGRLYSLGFSVKIPTKGSQAKLDQQVIRLGVAAFCSMNVMLLSFSDYLAFDSLFSTEFYGIFRYLSLVLCAISLLFAAPEFYHNAFDGWRTRHFNVDQPIVIALTLAFILSLFNTLTGLGFVYYDSITIIVLLLLIGRTFQSFVLDKARLYLTASPDLSMEFTRRRRSDAVNLVEIKDILIGDHLQIAARETIPVQCRLLSQHGYFSFESLTGEAEPKFLRQGDLVAAGAVCLEEHCELTAEQSGSDSYLLHLVAQRQALKHKRRETTKTQDRLAAPFLVTICLAAIIVAAYFWPTDPITGINRAMAVLLIACPCAIAFSAPLVLSLLEMRALKSGLIIADGSALEKLARVRKVFWDKTGTLSMGESSVARFEIDKRFQATSGHLQELIHHTQHHVIKALAEWSSSCALESSASAVKEFKESIGLGVKYIHNSKEYRIGSAKHCDLTISDADYNVWVTIDGTLAGRFLVVDQMRPESSQVVKEINDAGIEQYILSGDQTKMVRDFGSSLGLRPEHCLAELSPEAKLATMTHISETKAMIGNGFNDSLVLAGADIGITVPGSHLAAVNLSDIHVSHGDLRGVTQALKLARIARRRLRLISVFAVVYNSAALAAAMLGFVTPFMAAVLMPLSSITVVSLAAKG